MRRLLIRWSFLLVFVLVMGAIFVNLGEWQLRRLHERQARNDVVRTNSAAPVKPATAVFGKIIRDPDQWQRVEATGSFDADHQFQVRYRKNGAESGYEVVTPLRTDSGLVILVDRGFIAVPAGQQLPDTLPAPPAGPVRVLGTVRRSENGKPKAIDPVNAQVRLVNAPAIGKALPYPVTDGFIAALETNPPQTGGFVPLAPPDLSEGPHLSYAIQWFLFTGIAAIGLFVLIRSDLRERRKKQAAAHQKTDATSPLVTASKE